MPLAGYDVECARALRVAATGDRALGTVTIFIDAQAAIWRPGQKYAIMIAAKELDLTALGNPPIEAVHAM